jgi:hypothetical protein
VLAAPPDERVVAQRGGWYPTAVPVSTVEPSSWPEWLEHSPSMVWLLDHDDDEEYHPNRNTMKIANIIYNEHDDESYS